jgi:peptidoglycan/xylan/chitin deacetylase (PgdA/CDA1 family)
VFWWDKLENAFTNTPCRESIVMPIGRLLMSDSAQRRWAFKHLRSYVKTLPNLEIVAFVDELCKQLDAPPLAPRILNWDELRYLASEGLTIGAHTQTHPILNRISIQEARDEAVGSLRDLQREIGPIEPIFAYPGGYYTSEVVQVIKDVGFFLAFTTKPGTNDLNDPDLLLMRRNNIGRKADQSTMRARLLQASLL